MILICDAIKYTMVFVLIGIAVGIVLIGILIIKAFKTNSRVVLGINEYCRKCGLEIKGLRCSNCEKKSQSFGV